MKTWMMVGALVLSVGIGPVACAEAGGKAAPAAAVAAAAVGQPAPAFSLVDEAGKTHDLKDYAGKVVVLEWTNPECPFVKRHYDANTMEKMAGAWGADKVVWLAVNSSHHNKAADSQAWKQKENLSYPTLLDPDGKVGQAYGARTTPHMYVIDAQGTLRYAGAIDDDPRGRSEAPRNYVKEAVDAVLAGKDVPTSTTEAYGCSVKYRK